MSYSMSYQEFCQIHHLSIIDSEIILTHQGVTINSHFKEEKWKEILEKVKKQPA